VDWTLPSVEFSRGRRLRAIASLHRTEDIFDRFFRQKPCLVSEVPKSGDVAERPQRPENETRGEPVIFEASCVGAFSAGCFCSGDYLGVDSRDSFFSDALRLFDTREL